MKEARIKSDRHVLSSSFKSRYLTLDLVGDNTPPHTTYHTFLETHVQGSFSTTAQLSSAYSSITF
jgi:hypothetical protein